MALSCPFFSGLFYEPLQVPGAEMMGQVKLVWPPAAWAVGDKRGCWRGWQRRLTAEAAEERGADWAPAVGAVGVGGTDRHRAVRPRSYAQMAPSAVPKLLLQTVHYFNAFRSPPVSLGPPRPCAQKVSSGGLSLCSWQVSWCWPPMPTCEACSSPWFHHLAPSQPPSAGCWFIFQEATKEPCSSAFPSLTSGPQFGATQPF